MILSERVTSSVSLPGLAAVAVLAIVALPGWSFGRADQSAGDGTSATSAAEAASAAEDDPSAGPAEESSQQSPKSDDKHAAPSANGGRESVTDLKFTWPLHSSKEIEWPNSRIARCQLDDSGVLAIPYQREHGITLDAREVGTGAITVWTWEEERFNVQVTVRPETDAESMQGLKFELAVDSSAELSWPNEKIVRVQIDAPEILSVKPQTEHSLALVAKSPGASKIGLWNDRKQFAAVQVTVLARKPADDPETTENQEESAPVQFILPHQTTVPPQEPNQPRQAPRPGEIGQRPAPAQTFGAQADPLGQSDGSAPRTGQIDVASLGTAIIEAKGEIELASNAVQSLRRARDRVKEGVKEGELKAASIKLSTAEQKLAFLTRIAQAAYDSAKRELNLETKKYNRITQLATKNAISHQQFDQAQGELNAVQDRVKLLETIPGVRPAEN